MHALRTLSSFLSPGRLALALALCMATASGASAQPVLGETATQRLSLVAGPNLVSLRVYPQDRSIPAILGSHRSQVLMVKDASGAVYAPAQGIQELQEWPWAEALLIHALEPFTLTVTGAQISLASTLPLEPGWSWIPYLVDVGVAPQQAFASLGSAFSKVEDASGRAFPPADGGRALESMEPGVGYRVRLSEAAELAYSAPAAAVTVATIEEAVALQGLEIGQQVVVSDPVRGGTFVVRDSGAPSDGGTVFVPTEFTEETTATGLDGDQTLFDGPNDGGIVFDSFRLFYGPSDENFLDAVALHGHASGRGDVAGEPLLNTQTGRLIVPGGLRNLSRSLTGSKDVNATYRYATSRLRLQRIVEPLVLEGQRTTDYVRPEWWGALPYPTDWTPDVSAPSSPRARPSGIVLGDPVYDATDRLATAINAAEAGAAQAGRQHYVVLAGMYGYARVIEMQDQVVLKGEQDGVRDGQGLRVLKGAPWHYWAVKEDRVDPAYLLDRNPRDLLMVNSDPMVVLRHGRRSMIDRAVDMELDGNLAENDYVFSSEFSTASGERNSRSWRNRVEELLQNTPHWNGFTSSHQHADTVPGSNARLENVHAHDYGGNIILGSEPVHFGGSRDLMLGNTIKNHHLYRVFTAPGTSINRLELYGFSWASHIAFQQGHYRDVIFRNLARNPRFGFGDLSPEMLIGQRNDARASDDLFDSENPDGYYFGDESVLENVRFELDADFRPRQSLVGYDSGPLSLLGVTVHVEGDTPVSLASGGSDDLIDRSSFVVEDVVVEQGHVRSFVAATAVRISARRIGSINGNSNSQGIQIDPFRSGHIVTLYDVGDDLPGSGVYAPETVKIVPRNTDAETTLDVFVQRARFKGVNYPVMMTREDPDDPSVASRYKVFWRDVNLDRWRDGNNDRGTYRASGKLQYFQRVIVGDRTSEATGTLSSKSLTRASSGARYVDVDPKLFYAPQDPSYVTVTGRDAGRFLGWTDVGDKYEPVLRLSFSGTDPVSVKWTAAIRPIPSNVTFPE